MTTNQWDIWAVRRAGKARRGDPCFYVATPGGMLVERTPPADHPDPRWVAVELAHNATEAVKQYREQLSPNYRRNKS